MGVPGTGRNPSIKVEEKRCLFCGSILERRLSPCGRLESWVQFDKRIFCNNRCRGDWELENQKVKRSAHGLRAQKFKKNTCEKCGKTGRLDIHHIDGNWRNDNPKNLITLCRSCHILTHKGKI